MDDTHPPAASDTCQQPAEQGTTAAIGFDAVLAELAAEGIRVGRKRIARLMRQTGVADVSRRRFITATVKGDRRSVPHVCW